MFRLFVISNAVRRSVRMSPMELFPRGDEADVLLSHGVRVVQLLQCVHDDVVA